MSHVIRSVGRGLSSSHPARVQVALLLAAVLQQDSIIYVTTGVLHFTWCDGFFNPDMT